MGGEAFLYGLALISNLVLLSENRMEEEGQLSLAWFSVVKSEWGGVVALLLSGLVLISVHKIGGGGVGWQLFSLTRLSLVNTIKNIYIFIYY